MILSRVTHTRVDRDLGPRRSGRKEPGPLWLATGPGSVAA